MSEQREKRRLLNLKDPADQDLIKRILEDSDISDLSDEDECLNFEKPTRIGGDVEKKNTVLEECADVEECLDEESPEVEGLKETLPFTTTPKKDVKWRFKKNISTPIEFENVSVEENVVEKSPFEYFCKFIPRTLIEEFSKYTNIYVLQKGISFKPCSPKEIEVLIGLHIIMGTLKLPRVSLYWDKTIGIRSFASSMTRDRFFQLRSNLHLVDVNNDISQTDRIFKVRPIFDSIRQRCQELKMEKVSSVDEQIVPFRGNLNIKQYVKNKPNPWGIKIFALCGISGILYVFIVYQGSTTEIKKDLSIYGQSAAIVLQLSERFCQQGHELCFDNYFNSYNLLQVLKEKGINAAGTARINRFSKPPVCSDKECFLKGRGFSQEVISTDDVSVVKWVDTRSVVLASNFVGIGEEDDVRRWSKEKKEYIKVKRPEVVRRYNKGMGGVDLIDQLIALYRITIRSKKWTLRMIFHAVDLAVINSWLEYQKDQAILLTPKKSVMDLLHFRQKVADELINSEKPRGTLKRGRPSSISPATPTTSRIHLGEIQPSKYLRLDSTDHMPDHDNLKHETRCKNKNCTYKTNILCLKCNAHLCLKRGRNCFKAFHENK